MSAGSDYVGGGMAQVEGRDVHQIDQLGILEHGGDRLGALHAKIVVAEAAERSRGGMSEVFMGG